LRDDFNRSSLRSALNFLIYLAGFFVQTKTIAGIYRVRGKEEDSDLFSHVVSSTGLRPVTGY
jgi:hypothetical protein